MKKNLLENKFLEKNKSSNLSKKTSHETENEKKKGGKLEENNTR
jgi:hypothetical protein